MLTEIVDLTNITWLIQAGLNSFKASLTDKRARREHAAAHLKEGLMKGKWLW